jgi:hypothetical protein
VSGLPNLLIVGAAKAGTTSLHRYLDRHPEIFMSRVKELKFFYRGDWRERVSWYRSQFPVDAAVRGESTPGYTMHPWLAGVPERAHELVPDARIVYLVRDPLERLLAQYVEFFALRLEDAPLNQALANYDDPTNVYVMTSRYAYQLQRFREHFPDSQILVVDQRDLREARYETMRSVFEFLGIDPTFTTPAFEEVHNPRHRKIRLNARGVWLRDRNQLERVRRASRVLPTPIRERSKLLVADRVDTPDFDAGLRAELAAYLKDDADRLRQYTGKPFAHWSA